MFMLGAAWQKGLVPLRRAAIERAIELNGVAVEANKQAFEWGRRAAHDLAGVEALVAADEARGAKPPPSLDALIERRAQHLQASRGEADAKRYRALVERVRAAEREAGPRRGADGRRRALLSQASRRQGRMGSRAPVRRARVPSARCSAEFEGPYKLHFHIGAWPFARPDPQTGRDGQGRGRAMGDDGVPASWRG